MNKEQKEYIALKTIVIDGEPPNYRDADTCANCKYSTYDSGCKCGKCGYDETTCDLFGKKVAENHLCDVFEADS